MRAYLLTIGLFAGLSLSVLCPSASAALVWNADRGWHMDGGVLAGFITLEPEQSTNAIDLMNRARQEQQADAQSGTALDLYGDVLSGYPQSIFAAEAMLQRGLIYQARGQFATASKTFTNLLSRYPDYPNFNRVIGAMFATAQDVQDGKGFYLWGTIPWFSDTRVAINLYEAIIKEAPYSDYAPLSLMSLAILRNERGEPEEAIDALDRLTNSYPQSVLSGDAYIRMAETYASLVQGPDYDQGATRQALGYYQDYLILFPEGADIAQARAGVEQTRDTLARSKYDVGEFYYVYRNDLTAASVFFNESITEAPLSATAQQARVQLDKIDQGVLAPLSVADWIFGRYPAPNRRSQDAGLYEGSNIDPFQMISAPGDEESNIQRAAESAERSRAERQRRQQAATTPPLPKNAPKPVSEKAAAPQSAPAFTPVAAPAAPAAVPTAPATAPAKPTSAPAAPITAPVEPTTTPVAPAAAPVAVPAPAPAASVEPPAPATPAAAPTATPAAAPTATPAAVPAAPAAAAPAVSDDAPQPVAPAPAAPAAVPASPAPAAQ